MSEGPTADYDARGRTPDCLPFCLGGWHESECPVVADRVIPPSEDQERDRQQPWHPASRGWVG